MQCSVRSMTEAKPISDTLPKKGKVTEVCKEWLVHEDGALAYALQQQEVERHYHNNKARNALLREDVPFAVNEQKREYEEALTRHNQQVLQQEEKDAAVAKRLAEEFAAREEICKARIMEKDSRLAQQLQERMKGEQAGDVNTVGLPLPGPRPPVGFRDPVLRQDEEIVRVHRHKEEWVLKQNDRLDQISSKEGNSGHVPLPGMYPSTSSRLLGQFPSTCGMNSSSSCPLGMMPPGGMVRGVNMSSPPRAGISSRGINSSSSRMTTNSIHPPSPPRHASANLILATSDTARISNVSSMNSSACGSSRPVVSSALNPSSTSSPPMPADQWVVSNGVPRDLAPACLVTQNLLPLPAKGMRRSLMPDYRSEEVQFSEPELAEASSDADALGEIAAACPVVEALGRPKRTPKAKDWDPRATSERNLTVASDIHTGPVHCTQPPSNKMMVAGDVAVAGPSSRDVEDSISPWPPPPSTQELDRHQQEILDEELARQLQEVLSAEDDQESRDRAVAIEAQDLEIARMLQDKERAKARRARERARAKAAARREAEASGSPPSLVEEETGHEVIGAKGDASLGAISGPGTCGNGGIIPPGGGVTPSTSGGLVPGAGGNLVPNIAAAIDPTFSRPVRSPSSGVDLIRASSHTTPPSHVPAYDEEDTTVPYFPVQGQKRTSSLDKKKKNRAKDTTGCKQQ